VIQHIKNEKINEKLTKISGMLTFDPLGDQSYVVTELRSVGKWISDNVLPPNCFKCCHNGLPRTVDILCDQNDIPWELVLVDDRFLSELVIHARYPFVGRGRKESISYKPIPRMAVVIGKSVDLPNAHLEINEIASIYYKIFSSRLTVIQGESVTPDKLRRMLENGGEDGAAFDIIHFVGHGASAENAVWLKLPSAPFMVKDIPPVLFGNPLIFWNACYSAGSPPGLIAYQAGILSAFGTKLLAGGASHFIGALLPIQDKAARQFAACFYSHLFGAAAVGEAFFAAKSEVGKTDPIVHTYSLYGNPGIKVCTNG
jgi:hypothetical protein